MESHVIALSGCYLISTCMYVKSTAQITSVSMPSRAVTSFLQPSPSFVINKISTVSMPSRAVTSFLRCSHTTTISICQCVNALSGCYLISTSATKVLQRTWNLACQCPLGLLPHFYSTPSKT